MNLITHIKNIIFLLKNKPSDKINLDRLVKAVKRYYTKKDSWVRNRTALLIKKIRKEKPYKIIDYSEAKNKYDSITPIDMSLIKEGSYVVKFSREEPVRGERYCEYFINQGGTVGVYKVEKWNTTYNYWSVVNYKGDNNTFGNAINNKSIRSFRFATQEEIEEFISREKEYKKKKKQIKKLQDKINELYREL